MDTYVHRCKRMKKIARYSARCNNLIEYPEYNLKVEIQDVYQSNNSSRVEDAMMY